MSKSASKLSIVIYSIGAPLDSICFSTIYACATHVFVNEMVSTMSGNDIAHILGERFGVVARHGALALEKLDLAADAAVLDVGTGAGNFAIYLAAEGFQVLTGEPSTDETHYAGQDWANNAEKAGVRDNIRFEAFDASDMPFPPEMF